ncbi:hypothetical protein [Desulfotruncus alcoholivorax]|uniref:hypothetical protein n=1 Tax=Desulfotruncus alcoholivorax TaxID=265477 RepID=UPI0004128A70|nr:hypothetical protein [Desulfotruncus alcoholivorax]
MFERIYCELLEMACDEFEYYHYVKNNGLNNARGLDNGMGILRALVRVAGIMNNEHKIDQEIYKELVIMAWGKDCEPPPG